MSLKIMKLAIESTTNTTLHPKDTKFFAVASADVPGGEALTLTVDEFFDDTGESAAELPSLNPADGYMDLYINGVLQMDGILSYTPGPVGTGQIEISVPPPGSIVSKSPIVLKVVNYKPASSTHIHT